MAASLPAFLNICHKLYCGGSLENHANASFMGTKGLKKHDLLISSQSVAMCVWSAGDQCLFWEHCNNLKRKNHCCLKRKRLRQECVVPAWTESTSIATPAGSGSQMALIYSLIRSVVIQSTGFASWVCAAKVGGLGKEVAGSVCAHLYKTF